MGTHLINGQVPLYCGFREDVIGSGFVARVKIRCRVLAEQEREGWWLYGVNPGAIAASGKELHDAVCDLGVRLRAALIDFAKEAPNFVAFEKLVNEFFVASNPTSAREWDVARAAARQGKFGDMNIARDTSERGEHVYVEHLELHANANVLESGSGEAMAA